MGCRTGGACAHVGMRQDLPTLPRHHDLSLHDSKPETREIMQAARSHHQPHAEDPTPEGRQGPEGRQMWQVPCDASLRPRLCRVGVQARQPRTAGRKTKTHISHACHSCSLRFVLGAATSSVLVLMMTSFTALCNWQPILI